VRDQASNPMDLMNGDWLRLACLRIRIPRLLLCSIFLGWFSIGAWAQNIVRRPRITQAVDEAQLTLLPGNTHPLARPAFDRGIAPADLPMERMLLVLKRSPEAELSLQDFLQRQQDKSSPDYHKWVTPDQFGQQFGPAPQDVQAVEAWLQSHGFRINRVSRGLSTIEFSGTADQVRQAFRTEIHKYAVNGEEKWANASDPWIPAALSPVVAGINSLHNFTKMPAHREVGVFSRSSATGQLESLGPQFTYPVNGQNLYGLGPYDFATIYNVMPLWNENLDGSGQAIAIVGQTNINIQDVRNFRNLFGLPPNDPQVILDGNDPGIVPGDETESLLDVEWSGAVAKGATIKFVASASTDTGSGVDLSALFIIDNNLAPVMSESYNLCERFLGEGNQFFNALWEQAAAQGITVIVASGDAGSADCDTGGGYGYASELGLSINGLASTPFDVAVGGTDFNDFNTQNSYWNANNDTHQASVKGYIPETTWNDSCTNSQLSFLTGSSDPYANCNDIRVLTDSKYDYLNAVGAGGGESSCAQGCGSGYPKPTWQSGPGVPQDGVRDIPDVSLFASNGFNGSFYLVCEQDLDPNQASCNLNSPYSDFIGLGGTSAGAPTFAGIMGIVNQFTESNGQGNANYVLYPLAASQPKVFNDITAGTIALPCVFTTTNCVVNPATAGYGVLSAGTPPAPAFSAGPGYDLATGLGSVNAYNLVHDWSMATFTQTSTSLVLNNANPVTITHGEGVPVAITVSPKSSGQGTPTGEVSLIANGQSNGAGVDGFQLVAGSVSGATNSTFYLPAGNNYSVVAHYGGDGIFGASDSQPVYVTVLPEASATSLSALTVFPTGLFSFNSLPYGTIVYVRADVTNTGTGINPDKAPSGGVMFTDTFDGVTANLVGDPFRLDIAGGTVVGNGVFTFGPGTHSIAASYSGDSNFNPSGPTPPSMFSITKAPTAAIIQSSTVTITPANPFTLTCNVVTGTGFNPFTGLYGGAATPTGSVTFYYGTTQLGNSVAVTGGVDPLTQTALAQASATFAGSVLPRGVHNISAIYTGDANYAGSNANAIPVSAGYFTSTAVTSSSLSAQPGNNVTFTATVTSTQTGGPPITGTIQFLVDGASSGSAAPVGQAQFSINTLPLGSHTIEADYSGDSNYVSSMGTIVEMIIGPADFSFSTTPPALPVVNIAAPGETSGPVTFTITPVNGYTGTVNFSASSCAISPAGSLSSCSFNPTSIISGGSTQVTIHTTAAQTATSFPNFHFLDFAGWRVTIVLLAIYICLLFVPANLRRRRRLAFGIPILILLLVSHGCGGGGGSSEGGAGGGTIPGTPTGITYTVTVNASSGQLSHNANFTFIVQ
jgi:Pro-kumamolisin, activation domain/Bacterial Ig-like domain (group 3)